MSSRRNWDSPNPSPAGECPPPSSCFWGEGHTRYNTYNVVLCIYICTLCIIFTLQYWTSSIQQQTSNANNFIDISEGVTYLLTYFFTNIFITILRANSIDIPHEAYLLTYISQIYSIYNYSQSQCC